MANQNYNGTYKDVGGAEDAYNKILSQVQGVHSDSGVARQNITNNINQAGDQFKSLFKNNIGRDATDDELSKFFQQSGDTLADQTYRSGQPLRNYTAQFIGDNFQQEANTEAKNKLSDLATQAGGLADNFMSMGQKSLASLTDSLRSYQTSLFDKLHPQLSLAAQAGGYQDSGGQTLQEQGALKDLGNQAAGILIPYGQQIQDQANAIRYGGTSAPYSLASSFAANQPNVNAAFGAGGLNFNDTNSMANLNLQRQLQLMRSNMLNQSDLWTNTQPSFGTTLGNSFANSFGKSAGSTAGNIGSSGLNNFGQWLSSPAAGAPALGAV